MAAPRAPRAVDPDDFEPRKFGVKYEPPTIVLAYSVPSTGKTYHRRMRLRRVTADSDAEQLADRLIRKHSDCIGERFVERAQVVRLVQSVIDYLRTPVFSSSDDEGASGDEAAELPQGDLQTVSQMHLAAAKAKMAVVFDANVVKPGDDNYEYDKQVDFGEAEEDCDWDD